MQLKPAAIVVFSFAALLLSLMIPHDVLGAAPRAARIVAHVVARHGQDASPDCGNPPLEPCNDGEANFTVHEALGPTPPTRYDIYILVTDALSAINGVTYGVAGVTFGISYKNTLASGVDVIGQSFCGDLYFTGTTPVWPASGSGVAITWNSDTNCQSTPATGDLDGGVTTVAAVLRVDVYSNDVFSITRREDLQSKDFAITTCNRATIMMQFPEAAGKASFGSADTGYDPCRGRFSSFTEFTSLSSSELESAVVKLTPVSNWQLCPPVFLLGSQATMDSSLFASYHRVAVDYANDVERPEALHEPRVLSTSEMEAVFDSIAATSEVIDGDVDSPALLSVGLFKTYGGTPSGYEAILNTDGARALLQRIRGAISMPEAVLGLDHLTCCLNVLPTGGPTNVTGLVSVQVGGFRLDHLQGDFVSSVRVVNTSGQSLPAPVSLFLNEGMRVFVVNPTGYGCRFANPGPTYFDLDVGTTFEPNEIAEVTVRIKNTLPPKLSLAPFVCAGPGMR